MVALGGCQKESAPSPATAPAASAAAEAVTNGTFTALTYNVAGLPAIISSSSPAVNTTQIGTLIRSYDIVHVQEDFNYHAALYAADNHPFRTSTSGGVPFGDGLNTLSKYVITDFQRVKWANCRGTDCLTPKGFTYSRIRLAEGVYLDFYNAHPNAGDTPEDKAARRANITQLSQFIALNSVGNAVLVMGDTNCRYTRAEDVIRTLTDTNGLTDVWIKTIRNNSVPALGAPALTCGGAPTTNQCEVVDKIFYRGNRYVTLNSSGFQQFDPRFVNVTTGEDLSDHYPMTTTFGWTLNPAYQLSDLFGGPHGTPYTDVAVLPAAPKVSKLTLRGGSRVDRVALTLTNGTTLAHGGTGGTERTLTLNAGEVLTSVRLNAGKKDNRTRIFFAEFRTSANRTLAVGTGTADAVTYTAPAGWQIVGFHGRAGSEVDKLGVIYAPR
ncbi:MAG: endonuclease [Hymenobacter sp.]|nr:endonuclease [Hymenobacter sp.]